MDKIDLIISKIEAAQRSWHPVASETLIEEALAAARELKAMKPVAWVVRRTTSEGDLVDGVWTCDSDDIGAFPVYALDDEVKHD